MLVYIKGCRDVVDRQPSAQPVDLGLHLPSRRGSRFDGARGLLPFGDAHPWLLLCLRRSVHRPGLLYFVRLFSASPSKIRSW